MAIRDYPMHNRRYGYRYWLARASAYHRVVLVRSRALVCLCAIGLLGGLPVAVNAGIDGFIAGPADNKLAISTDSEVPVTNPPLAPPLALDPCLFCLSYPKLIADDAVHALTAPVRWQATEWYDFALDAAIVVGSMALLDEKVQAAAQRRRNPGSDKFAKNIEQLGERYSFVVLGGFYAAGSALNDTNAKMVALDGLSASIIAGGLITPVLKEVVGRSRPHAEQGAHDFHPFNGSKSFPSGHTTQAFSVASVIAQHYESPWVSAGAYGVATLVGYARIEQNAHFLSDVLAGAMIGIGVGKSVTSWNHEHQAAFAVLPLLAPHERGIELTYTF